MKYIEIKLRSEGLSSLNNEVLFEIASARASGIELLKFIFNEKSETKIFEALVRQMKKIKQRGIIQFFATHSSFDDNTTEVKFLINKYPQYFNSSQETLSRDNFIYVKI